MFRNLFLPRRDLFRLTLAVACICGSLGGTATPGRTEGSSTTGPERRLFIAPDENSEIAARIDGKTGYVPVAVVVGSDGATWYLVRSDAGATGWFKESNSDAAKKLESYFKPVSVAISFPNSRDASPPGDPSSRSRIGVPVEISGAKVIVAVTFNNSVTANLALDTGAEVTMVSRRIARNLGLASVGSTLMAGVGGTVMTQMARVESVKIADAAVANLTVAIHDFSRDPHYEGLLGLDFLKHFEMSLDSRKRQLFLTPR
jgi:predicted aspartyl protease